MLLLLLLLLLDYLTIRDFDWLLWYTHNSHSSNCNREPAGISSPFSSSPPPLRPNPTITYYNHRVHPHFATSVRLLLLHSLTAFASFELHPCQPPLGFDEISLAAIPIRIAHFHIRPRISAARPNPKVTRRPVGQAI